MAGYLAPKGMRDFLPDEMEKREWAIETVKSVYRKYGFLPMDTPALENVEVLEKKCGEEIRGQLFRIDDGRLALRFDLTVPLARVAASNTFKKPFKRYCIAPVWRREEPQKARYREFYQADADIIGCPSVKAEAELIACACDALAALGFFSPTVRISDRRIAYGIARSILPGKESALLRLLDKKGKVSKEKMMEEFGKLLEGKKDEAAAKKFEEFLGIEGASNEKQLELASKYSKEASDCLRSLLLLLKEYNVSAKAEIDLSLVRGMDYYTGPIFEIKLSDEIGSVGGGGRYDGLLALYGQGDYAVGLSLGIERLMFLMRKKAMSKKGVFVACVKEEHYPYAIKIASRLRAEGIAAQTDLNARSLQKQIEFASERCAWAAIVGEMEMKEGKVTLRDLESGQEQLASIEEAIEKIRKK